MLGTMGRPLGSVGLVMIGSPIEGPVEGTAGYAG